jgi:multidrug efflux pump subunit AcrA (membrane-fusion protein)
MGLQVTTLVQTQQAQELRGAGRVLDPSALAVPFYDRESARAALEVTEKEYQRVEKLQRGSANASQRELEAAHAALERDRSAFDSAQARLASVFGPELVARRDELAALVHALALREIAVARIDLPVGESPAEPPTGARVSALGDEATAPKEARILGPAPDADPLTQGRGFLVRIEGMPWPPGTAVVGFLALAGPPTSGVLVPRSALVRYEGRTFIYLAHPEDSNTIERRPVEVAQLTSDGAFIPTGLAAGDQVVVVGAQQLLSTEIAGAISED